MGGFCVLAVLGVLGLLKTSSVTCVDTIDHEVEPPEGHISMIHQDDPVILLSTNSTSPQGPGFVVLLPDSLGMDLPLNDSGRDLNELDGDFIGMGSVLMMSFNDTMSNDTDLGFSRIPSIGEDFIRKKRSSEVEEIREKRSPTHKKRVCMRCMMRAMMCGGGCGQPAPPPSSCGGNPCGPPPQMVVYQPAYQPAPQPVYHPPPRPAYHPAPQPVYQPAPQPVYQPPPQQQCCPCGQAHPGGGGMTGSYASSSAQSGSYGMGG